MEGRGITNYSTEKPSFAFSTRTTEFDDALVERGIVTLEQAFGAKGASAEEAQRLASLKRNEKATDESQDVIVDKKKPTEYSDDDESDESEDDEFLEQYRRQRLEQLKKEQQAPYGEVIPISRPEWTRQVNEDSNKSWVVVTLTSHDVERTGCVESAATKLARKFPSIKFVTIPSTAAIADWPDENLPTVFLYRNGKLQKELIRIKRAITCEELEWQLAEASVVETDMEEPPTDTREEDYSRSRKVVGSSSIFGGSLSQLETRRYESDDEDSDGT